MAAQGRLLFFVNGSYRVSRGRRPTGRVRPKAVIRGLADSLAPDDKNPPRWRLFKRC